MPPPRVSRRVLLAGCGGLLAIGCEVRDEEARAGPAAEWLEATAQRLSQGPATGPQAAVPAAGLEWIEGFEAGSRRAAERGLPLLLIFRAAWCRWSGELAEKVMADEQLLAATGRIVCASIDADREAAVCRSFGVRVFPTIIVLDADRRERFRGSGRAARRGLDGGLQAALAPAGRRIAAFPESASR